MIKQKSPTEKTNLKNSRVYLRTYGCQMNDYDSSKIVGVLENTLGTTITKTPNDADIIILNTCSVREKAQEKVFSELGRLRPLKESNPNIIIAVGGCVASQEGKTIIQRAPYVDIVFGPATYHRLPTMIEGVRDKQGPIVDVSFPEIEKFDYLPKPRAEGPTAFVSIMEGCNKYCTYCIVPTTRGKEISRPFDDVIIETVQLADQGVKEITYLGQNVNGYQWPRHDGRIADLATLIHYAAAIDGVERIRFTTSHPLAFSDALIEVYAEEPKLVNHLHLPVQSGSDRILGMMHRGYTARDFFGKIEKLRTIRPQISISSDFIVGFPGETDDDFQATLNLVRTVNFDHSFSFIYSPRPGTPAARLHDNIPLEEKKRRLTELQTLLTQQEHDISKAMVGTKQRVLISNRSKRDPSQLSGRTENNRVVNFAGDSSLIGRIIEVKITEALPNSLRGIATQTI